THGYLLSLRSTAGGEPLDGDAGLEVQPLEGILHGEWWYSLDRDDLSGEYRAVLPADIYYVTAHNPPAGYYPATLPFDLRSADLDADLPFATSYVHPIPYDPPIAVQISVGPPDDLGEATVTGAAGAALPLARILLVNLSSGHQAHTISQSDGSFAARIYAPPGSALMVKHGPASHRWSDLEQGVSEGINPFPGTILQVPHTHTADPPLLPFAGAGGLDLRADDAGETHNYVGAAWAITGTLGPVTVDGQWTRVLTGTYEGATLPGLYLGGLNWTHPALGDLDGDAAPELLVGADPGRLVLYRNHGTATVPQWQFETERYAGLEAPWWAYPLLADVTGDGALDLFVGSGDGHIFVYYNQGTPSAAAWPATPDLTLSAGENAAPALDDLDADGDLDLLAGHLGGTLYLFRNAGTPTAPVWSFETDAYAAISELGEGLQPAFVDLDGDADLDLLLGLCGTLLWYERGGPPAGPTWTRHADDPIGLAGGSCGISPGAGDWNGDGRPDLVTGEHWGGLRFFRNEAPSTWAEQAFSLPFELGGDTAPALGDWDDDGDPDLLAGLVWGQVLQYQNDGSPAAPDWSPQGELLSLPWTDHPHAFPTFADLDGDDDLDLFVGEGGWQGPGAGGNIHYYQNVGTPSAPNWTLVTDTFLGLDVGGWSTPVFVDIDADLDLDLFVGDEAGTLTFVENTGSPTAPAWAPPVQAYAELDLGDYTAPCFLDLDADGDLDLLAGLGSGTLAYVRNTGTLNSPAWELVSTVYPGIDVGGHATPAATDLDGDGDADLLVGDGDGGLNLFLYEGPGSPPGTGVVYQPGDLLQVDGILRFHGNAITASTNLDAVDVQGWLHLLMLFDAGGRSLPAENYFMSTMLTPGGFPVQAPGRPSLGADVPLTVEGLHHAGGHTLQADLSATGRLPDDLPPGIYRPVFDLHVTGVPTDTTWLAANVVRHTFGPNEAPLPPVTVGQVAPPRLDWRLLMDDFVQGTRGTAARQDQGTFEIASQIVSQGTPYILPPHDAPTGQSRTYRLEPFLPVISFSDRRMPTPPLLPFDLPGGQLSVSFRAPDGTTHDLGSQPLAQSFNRTKTTRGGADLNVGTVQLDDVYSLQAASAAFRTTFDQYGHYVVTMTGSVPDLWGNLYEGGGTYDLWLAEPLDIDPGVLPGTPLAVGDAFDPALQLHPRVPARVELALTLYPDSDPSRAETYTVRGWADRFGYFSPAATLPIPILHPGEYRVDLTAAYTATDGLLYMAAMTWGGIVMTPPDQADLVAHGRRGLDSLSYIPSHWFVACRDLQIPPGAVSHTLNPYYNGDLLWTRMSDGPCGGDSLVLGASLQDRVGVVEAAIQARAERMMPELYAPGTFEERIAAGELPLFVSTRSGRPPQLVLGPIGAQLPGDVDQIAYSYRSSQRPGVRVREVVAQDGQSGGYWRLDTLYDDQLGVGILGDQPNDFKFQYVSAVYRDLDTGRNEYLGQGTGWVFLPDDDPTGSRVMPPFAGPGNGGWTTEGGPLLTLKGHDVHIFILPTGVRPGAVLEVGDTFRFAGHIMPTLDSQVAVTVTAPGGTSYLVDGQANPIGYFYDPQDDFLLLEPGLWTADVRVWHDGLCSGGSTVPPYPSGDLLGSDHGAWPGGRYYFYVVPSSAPRLDVSAPIPGFLTFDGEVTPIAVTGTLPAGLDVAVVDFTLSMPGYILEQGQATIDGGVYRLVFDPVALHQDYPNLDLVGRDEPRPGLADTVSLGLLLRGQAGGQAVYRANTLTFQGQQVFVGDAPAPPRRHRYLPLILKSDPL
ncbi:MAG: VCBS repeat-containing protein, partial [Anaerolineae bacterium]